MTAIFYTFPTWHHFYFKWSSAVASVFTSTSSAPHKHHRHWGARAYTAHGTERSLVIGNGHRSFILSQCRWRLYRDGSKLQSHLILSLRKHFSTEQGIWVSDVLCFRRKRMHSLPSWWALLQRKASSSLSPSTLANGPNTSPELHQHY